MFVPLLKLVVSVERASPRGYAIFISVRLGGDESSLRDRHIPSLDVKYYTRIILFCAATFSWSFTIFQSPTPVTAPILRTWRHYWPFRRSTCDLQSSARLLLSRFLVQSGVGSRELLLGLVTQVCALTPRTRYRLQPFPSARRLVAARAPLTPANFRSSLAGLPPPLA